MKSLIDPRREVSKQNWCISLVKHRTHTILVIESIGLEPGETYRMRTFDFLPQNHKILQSIIISAEALATNKKFPAEVREIIQSIPYNTLHEEALSRISVAQLKEDRKVLFKVHAWAKKHFESWPCAPENVYTMLGSIRNDIVKSKNNELMLQYRGRPGNNCTSWAEKKLNIAGIKVKHHHPVISMFAYYSGTLIGRHHLHFKQHDRYKNQDDQHDEIVARVGVFR